MSHSLTVCKFKAHKRCAVRATNNCKWTTLASIGKDIIEDEDGVGSGGCRPCVAVLFSCRHPPPGRGPSAAPTGLCSDLFSWV